MWESTGRHIRTDYKQNTAMVKRKLTLRNTYYSVFMSEITDILINNLSIHCVIIYKNELVTFKPFTDPHACNAWLWDLSIEKHYGVLLLFLLL